LLQRRLGLGWWRLAKPHPGGDVLPLLTEDEKLTAEESENLYKLLRKHGISEKAARKIVEFYEEG
jgi:hypothetical protein